MEILLINSRKSLETLASVNFSNELLTVTKVGVYLYNMRQAA